jgi:hypothetical protein
VIFAELADEDDQKITRVSADLGQQHLPELIGPNREQYDLTRV